MKWYMQIALCVAFAINAHAQRSLLNVPDADIDTELSSFTIADGFEVNLFASDPMIANPIHMNWDDEGRLWVVGSTVYPQIAPGEPTSDTITVLEDTDNDGVADTSTVFADDLFIPTGVLPGDGGVYVANSTEVLFLKDTNGDGLADSRRVVLSGFGTEDTHQILHSLRWGFDGLLYMNQSIYIHSHIETPHGVRRLNAAGIWQFRPDTMELDVFSRGFVNPWGNGFYIWGQAFATDGAYHEGINYVFPGAAFFTADAVPRVLKGLNEGQPKHCSLEILSGRHIPEDWQGTMVTNDFRGQRVCRFLVTEEQAGYASVEQPALMKSTHVSFRPVDVKMGPDGAIYIADWYNPIIQHGEVDFRDPRRDHEHGRIWRLTAKGRPLVEAPDIKTASVDELIALLRVPEDWNRTHAKRELKVRDRAQVLAALDSALTNLDSASPDFERARLEILWTYQTLDEVNLPLLDVLLGSSDYHVRAAAVRVLSQWKSRLNDEAAYVSRLASRMVDEHPRVRLEAVRALARVETAQAADIAMQAFDQPKDRFVEYALWTTMRDLKDQWLPALDTAELAFVQRTDSLLYALNAVDGPAAVAPLLRVCKERTLSPEQQHEALAAIVKHGSASDMGAVTALILVSDQEATLRAALLQEVVDGSARRALVPEGDLTGLAALIESAPAELQAAAINAAGAWKVESLRPVLESLAGTAETPDTARRSAINAVAALGGNSASALLKAIAESEQPMDMRTAAVQALLRLAPDEAAQLATAILGTIGEQDPTPIYQSFLQADGGLPALTAALADAQIDPQVAKLGVRAVSTSGRDEPDFINAVRKAGGLGEAPTEIAPERMAELVAAVTTQGDPARGYEQYRKLECAQCHAIAGSGGSLGPELTSIGGSAQPDYLIDAIYFPAKAIKDGYHSVIVETNDFQTYSGIKTGQTDSELILRNATDDEIRIAINTIDTQTDGGSLMPTDLADTLLENEFVDLIAFLSALGRAPEFSADTARHVRTWRTLSNTQEAIDYLYEAQPEAALAPHETLTWVPAYSHVSGAIPIEELPEVAHRYWVKKYSFVQFTIDAPAAGCVALSVTPREGVRLFAGGQAIELADVTLVNVTEGQTLYTLILDRALAKGDLDIQLVDNPAVTVTAKFAGGK